MGKNIFDRYLTSVVHSSMPIRVKVYNEYIYIEHRLIKELLPYTENKTKDDNNSNVEINKK